MKRANTMSTITVELIITMKTKFTSSNAEKTDGFISPQMSHNFHKLDILISAGRSMAFGNWEALPREDFPTNHQGSN